MYITYSGKTYGVDKTYVDILKIDRYVLVVIVMVNQYIDNYIGNNEYIHIHIYIFFDGCDG